MPKFETVDINLHFEQISVHIALLFRVMFWVIVAKRQQENFFSYHANHYTTGPVLIKKVDVICR